MTSMTFTGTLIDKVTRTPDAVSYHFTRPPDYRFTAGQSYSITIPSPEGPLQHRFSHADSPSEPFTELTTRLTGSPFKNALDSLPLGSEATFRGPAGRFVFRYEAPRIVFLTGGIGITPVRSMLRYLVDTKGAGRTPGQELLLFYGCLTELGIVYRDELDEFARVLPGLRVVYVITEPIKVWTGPTGFITAELIAEEVPEPAECTYYVAGPPPMITAMDKVTAQLRIPATQMVKENFAGYAS